MSPRHPVINGKQLAKALEKKGFVFTRQCGSHAIYKNKFNARVTVPIHEKKDIPTGTLLQILTDAKISFDELKKLL